LYGAVAFNNVGEFARGFDIFAFVREDALTAEDCDKFSSECLV
jgi:hypothetical protein